MAKNIKNIIFDLGGVIINLDIPLTTRAFLNLNAQQFTQNYTQLHQTALFDDFDKGLIKEDLFFQQLKDQLQLTCTDTELIDAWNAMLLDFPSHRLEMLMSIKSNYRTFLLSNTNETHVTAFEAELLKTQGYTNLDTFFEKTYYSCRMGMRKPDTNIFEFVLQQNGLIPEETLFIDDSPQHIEGAKLVGIQAYLLEKEKEVSVLLKELGVI